MTRLLLDAVAFCLVVAVVGYLLGYWWRAWRRMPCARLYCPDCRGTGHSGHLHDECCPTCAGGRWQE